MALGPDQITAINFKEFYARILPYLNGAGANDYSTEEKIVGSWIDGKPVYQKTITGFSLHMVWQNQNNAKAEIESPISYDEVDAVLDAFVTAKTSTGKYAGHVCTIIESNNHLIMYAPEDLEINTLTLQYTKTTD